MTEVQSQTDPGSAARKIKELGVFPIMTLDRPQDAVKVGEALLEGGLPCAEVTFRTSAAGESIRKLRDHFSDLLLGAGTVLTRGQARDAVDAGVHFIVAPGFNRSIVEYCLEQGVEIFPGVCTPTDIEAALNLDLKVLKFFPAEQIGGIAYLRAIAAPYSMIRFIPTGGVNLENLADYLGFKGVLACGGSWMVKKDWIAAGQFDRIQQEAGKAVQMVSRLRGGLEND